MSIVEQEKRLFAEWKKRRQYFVPDGVVNEKSYTTSSPRLLFLLKEVNFSDDDFDLRQFLGKGARSQT